MAMDLPVSATKLQQKALHLIHYNYYKNFFLLRTEILVNDEQVQLDTDERGWLTINSQNMKVGVTFDSLVTDMNDALHQYGLHGVSNYWCDEVPLFELNGSTPIELKKLLNLQSEICDNLALKITERMKDILKEVSTTTIGNVLSPALNVEVKPELYLIIPDYEEMDGRPVRVTEANFTECMDLFGSSGVFDFGAIFRTYRSNPSRYDTGPADLAILHAELNEVVNWFDLGQALLVPDTELQIIHHDYNDTRMCKSAMLNWWWNHGDDIKWLTIVQALARTGSYRLAAKLALKYDVPEPLRKRSLTCPPEIIHGTQESRPDGDESAKLIAKLRKEINERDYKLAQQSQTLKDAEKLKEMVSRRLRSLNNELSYCQSRNQKLENEKRDMMNRLELIEYEFDILSKNTTNEIRLHKMSINAKQNDILDLKAQLQLAEFRLEENRIRIPQLEKDLQKATTELGIKSAEVDMLRESKNDMQKILIAQMSELDNHLIKQAAANMVYDCYKTEQQEVHEKVNMSTSLEGRKMLVGTPDPTPKFLDLSLATRSASCNNLSTSSPEPNMRPATSMSNISVTRKQSFHGAMIFENDSHQVINNLKWETKKEAPQGLRRGSAAVDSLTSTAYIINEDSNVIYCYRMHSNEWSTLPVVCPHINPGLVFIENILTAIGGQKSGKHTTKSSSFKKGKWINKLPRMHYPHNSPSVINYAGSYVIVAGGSLTNEINMVELYSITSRSWFKMISLPRQFYGVTGFTATVHYNDFVVMDGRGTTFSINLYSLILLSTSDFSWIEKPYLPMSGKPALTTFNKEIICISSEGMHRLSNDHGWVKVPNAYPSMSPRRNAIVCALGDHQTERLVMIGGHNSDHYSPIETEVCVAQKET